MMGVYMLLDTDRIKKGTFRSLVIALFLSFGYDVLWLLMSASTYSLKEAVDGGVEFSVRKFSLWMAIFSLFFRVNSFRNSNIRLQLL
jgi:hypothetical protein